MTEPKRRSIDNSDADPAMNRRIGVSRGELSLNGSFSNIVWGKQTMVIEALQGWLEAQRAQLVAEREQFVAQVNQKLGEYAGRLGQIDAMLQQLNETPPNGREGSVEKADPALAALKK